MLIPQLALLALLSAGPFRSTYPWHLEREFTAGDYTIDKVLYTEGRPVVDISGNGVEEYLVEKLDGFSDQIYNQDGSIRAQLNYPTTKVRTFLGARDITHDTRKELFFFFRNAGDTAFLRIWYPQGDSSQIQRLFPLPHHTTRPEWNGAAYPAAFLDVNGDGYEDILIPMGAGFDLEPRGIYAYDFRHQRKLWFYPMATLPEKLELSDLNGDGAQEIIAYTDAPGNGARVDGFDDSLGRLFVLNQHGELLWERPIGRYGGGPEGQVADVDLDGKPEIVACASGVVLPDTLPGQVFILDGTTGSLERYVEFRGLGLGIKVCDLNRDKHPNVLIGGANDGTLRIFDQTLTEVKEMVLAQGPLELRDVRDLDADGTWEILLTPGYGKLIILSERLETLLHVDTDGESFVCLVRNGRKNRLLLASPNSVSLYDVQRTPPLQAQISLPYSLFIAFFLAGLFLLFLFHLWMSQRWTAQLLIQAPYPMLLLDQKGRVARANGPARSLLSEQELAGFKYPPLRPLAGYSLHPFSAWGRRLLLLEDKRTYESRDRALAWAGMAQSMAHEFKNPLSTLILAAQRLQYLMKGQEAVRYTVTLLEELQRLRARVDGFMRFLSIRGPELAPLDLKALLAKLRDKLSRNLPPGVTLELALNGGIPPVQGDWSHLEVGFTNLIDNALTAVGSRGRVTIRVSGEQPIGDGSRVCEIEIADDGPGISSENQARLFTPYFTTKPSGSGLGLVIARKVFEDHQGSLRIESREGIGTRVIVRLPASSGKGLKR